MNTPLQPVIVEHKKFTMKMQSHPLISSNYLQEDMAHRLKLSLRNLRYQPAEIIGQDCVIVADASLTFRPVNTVVKFPVRTNVKIVRNLNEEILVNKEISNRFSSSTIDPSKLNLPSKIFDPPLQPDTLSHVPGDFSLQPPDPPNSTARPAGGFTCPESPDFTGPTNIVCFSSVGPGVCEGIHEEEDYFAKRNIVLEDYYEQLPPNLPNSRPAGGYSCPESPGFTGPANIVCFSSVGPGVCEGIHEEEDYFARRDITLEDYYDELHRPSHSHREAVPESRHGRHRHLHHPTGGGQEG